MAALSKRSMAILDAGKGNHKDQSDLDCIVLGKPDPCATTAGTVPFPAPIQRPSAFELSAKVENSGARFRRSGFPAAVARVIREQARDHQFREVDSELTVFGTEADAAAAQQFEPPRRRRS